MYVYDRVGGRERGRLLCQRVAYLCNGSFQLNQPANELQISKKLWEFLQLNGLTILD